MEQVRMAPRIDREMAHEVDDLVSYSSIEIILTFLSSRRNFWL